MRKTKLLSVLSLAMILTSCSKTLNNSSSTISSSISTSSESEEPKVEDIFSFYDSDNISSIIIDDIIDKKVVDLRIPETINGKEVYAISNNAIQNLPNLKSIYFPKTILVIDVYNFANCPNLEKLEIDNDNPNFTVVNNCILSKSGNTLYKGIKTSVIPDTVSTIEEFAFYYSNITSVKIPKGVKEHKIYFYHCDELVDFQIDSENTNFFSPAGSNCWLGTKTNVNGVKYTVIYDIFKNGAIPENIGDISIDNFSFKNSNIENFNITKNIVPDLYTDQSADYAFWNLYNVKTLTVDSENAYYSTQEGSNCLLYRNSTDENFELYKIVGKKAIIPEGVTKIINIVSSKKVERKNNSISKAFYNLESIHFSKTFSAYFALNEQINYLPLQEITVDEENPYYKSIDNMLIYNNESYAKGRTYLVMVANNSKGNIPEEVTYINNYAFCGTNVTSIFIPKAVRLINESFANSCRYLNTITVDENNTIYRSNNNVVYENNQLFFITNDAVIEDDVAESISSYSTRPNWFSTGLKSIKFHDNYKYISCFFSGCTDMYNTDYVYNGKTMNFQTLDLSSTKISTMYYNALSYLSDLREIKFPKTLTRIDNNVLYHSNLSNVVFPDSLIQLDTGHFTSYTRRIVIPNVTTMNSSCLSGATNVVDLTFKMTLSKFKTLITSQTVCTNFFKPCSLLKTVKFLEYEGASTYIEIDVDKIY